MAHRRWITAFTMSFIPLGLWLLFWFLRVTIPSGFEPSSPALVFIIPIVLYVGFQIWLAIRASNHNISGFTMLARVMSRATVELEGLLLR